MFRSTAKQWDKYSKLGRTVYVIRHGVVGWGVPTAIFYSLIRGFVDGWDEFACQLLVAIIVFPLIGIFIGRLNWKWFEKQYGIAAATDAES
jgi:hypothetical protein